FDYGPDWYANNKVSVLTQVRAISVNTNTKELLLDSGTSLAYDSLILAHGSSASLPPFYRDDLPGVAKLRTVADVEEIISRISAATPVSIIGGGVLCLEAALACRECGAQVQVLEYSPRLMPRQLDAEAAGML